MPLAAVASLLAALMASAGVPTVALRRDGDMWNVEVMYHGTKIASRCPHSKLTDLALRGEMASVGNEGDLPGDSYLNLGPAHVSAGAAGCDTYLDFVYNGTGTAIQDQVRAQLGLGVIL